VAEYGDEIVFVKRVTPGQSDRSYGIHVGRLAGLPSRVVGRAVEILNNLEAGKWNRHQVPSVAEGDLAAVQIPLFKSNQSHPIVQQLAELELDEISAKRALEILYELKGRTRALELFDESCN
jgi:DNA mismatch repair protein MutS